MINLQIYNNFQKMFHQKDPYDYKNFQGISSQKLNQFITEKSKFFKKMRRIKVKDIKEIPSHFIFERIIFLSIIQRYSEEYQIGNSKQVSSRLNAILQKNRPGIISASNLSLETVERIQKRIDKFLTNFSLAVTDKNFLEQTTVYSAFLIYNICGKKQDKILMFIKNPQTYSQKDFASISKEFNHNIIYLDYDKKFLPSTEKVTKKDICILRAKQAYYILYSDIKDLNEIKIVSDQKNINKSELQRIFKDQKQNQIEINKSEQNSKEPSIIQKFLGADKKDQNKGLHLSNNVVNIKNIQPSILYAPKISCSVCGKNEQEFDCINWNYEYFCGQCVVDPRVDTSNIPASNIIKYCRERNLVYKNYEIICPQCTAMTKMKNYRPETKPKAYKCSTCDKVICLEHNGNIYECFCYCVRCQKHTIYVPKTNLNYCQYCKTRYCFTCKQQKKQEFCKCICSQCLNTDSKTHQCQPNCHRCHNVNSKLRLCQCGLFICYGCYYYQLSQAQQGKFECLIDDYC